MIFPGSIKEGVGSQPLRGPDFSHRWPQPRLDTNKSHAHMGTHHAWLSKRVGYSRQVRSSEQTECQLNFVYVFKGKTEGLSWVLF
jgi:hypothetical protein